MGRSKQWSVDTVRQVKVLMSIGFATAYRSADGRRAADAALFQCQCEEGPQERRAQPRGAHSKETDEMKRWDSVYLIAKPKSRENVIHTHVRHTSSWCRHLHPMT